MKYLERKLIEISLVEIKMAAKGLSIAKIAGGCISALVFFTGVDSASALIFAGDFSPANWTLTNTNADGSVDLSNVPDFVTLTGGDTAGFDTGSPGTTDYTITATNSSTISYEWSYSSIDSSGFDRFERLLNNVATTLADLNGESGTDSFAVNSGDTFGFRIATDDNSFGPGVVSVGQNIIPSTAVPFEFSPTLGLLLMGALWGGNYLSRQFRIGKK